MSFLAVLGIIGASFWDLLKHWLFAIFAAPFHNLNMLWILIPIYLAWIVADFFQEKRGTSMGNAISNGVIPLWAGIDWTRTTIDYLVEGKVKITFLHAASMFLLAACVLAYGAWIIYAGVKGRSLIRYIGRIRVVTYVVVLFTPVFYNVLDLTLKHIFATILFFPLFYFAVELLDRYLPDPESIKEHDGGQGGFSGGF